MADQPHELRLHERLPMWIVYDHPLDYPDGFIARLWVSLPQPAPTTETLTASTLEELRNKIRKRAPWMSLLTRRPEDEPQVVEVWL
jgi:hypothetical protein